MHPSIQCIIRKLIAAYLLAQLGGNESPSKKDLKTILSSVGIQADDSRCDLLVKELKGKNIAEIIAMGNAKLASVPSGGGGAVSAPAAASASKAEPTKVKEEEKEESDDDMGFGLFD